MLLFKRGGTGGYIIAMLLKMLYLTRWLRLPVAFALGLHGTVFLVLLYFSVPESIIEPKIDGVPFAVTMVDVAHQVFGEESGGQFTREVQSEYILQPQPEPIKKELIKAKSKPVVYQAKTKVKKIVKAGIRKETKTEIEETVPPIETTFQSEVRGSTVNNKQVKSVDYAVATKKSDTRGPRVLSKAKPVYPSKALALGLEGQVKVQYDIDESGRVTNVRVLEAKPRNLFEREVRQVMRKWRFEPVAAKDYVTTVVFKISGEMDMH